MKLYKVITKDNKATIASFDYTKYLPNGNKKGKWLPIIKDVYECNSGYHVTNYWNMWLESKDNRIFEVEVKGVQEKKDTVGVIEKYVCKTFRFVKEIFPNFDDENNTGNSNTGNKNTGNKNTGNSNTGYWNTGDWNTGYWNTGNWNTGYWNTGNSNTGYWNTGDWNTGNSNTGYWNTGNKNTGNSNTGYKNTGNKNTGNSNTGYWNTGDWNTGNKNTGNWNTSSFNTGFFNTEKIEKIKVFNKTCNKKEWDNCNKPNFIYFDINEKIGYKKSFIESFKKANKDDIKLLLELPNFDYKVFEDISGITKSMINRRIK